MDWFHPDNEKVTSKHLKIVQCPSAESNRVQDNALDQPGVFACSDYAGIREVPQALVEQRFVDPPASRDSIMMINVMWPMSDITDGTSNTILYAEDAGRPQLWHQGQPVPGPLITGGPWASRNLIWGTPWDAEPPPWPCPLNCSNHREIYSFHPSGANTVFAGSVHFLKAGLSIRVLAALVTHAGGEVVSSDDF